MRSNKTFPPIEHGDIRPAVEAVQISSDLIAFYPQPLPEQQPYVILLDAASGILKRLDLRATK